MTGYTRQSIADIIAGADILAAPLNNEFNALQTAFSGSVGHGHTGGSGDGPKIELTTSVSGILPVANGGTGLSDLATLTLTSTDDGAAVGPQLILYRNSASPAVSDAMGLIRFAGEDSAGGFQDYAEIRSFISDPTSGTEDAQLNIGSVINGVMTNQVILGPSGVSIPILGAVLPGTGTFTTLTATTVDLNGGAIDDTTIGATTRDTGAFTTLGANSTVTFTAGGSMTGTWSNLGTVTTIDINGGTVDGVTIGGASAGAGTFTTLTATGAFTSLGIDDNATGERLQIADGGIVVGTTNASYSILKADSLQPLVIGAGSSLSAGGALVLQGASDSYDLRAGGTVRYIFSGTTHTFTGAVTSNAGITGTTGTFSGAVTTAALTTSGAFTSLGIDDNATAERVQISDGGVTFGASGITMGITNADAAQNIIYAGGTTGLTGGRLILSGPSHATTASDIFLASDGDNVYQWDESALSHTFSRGPVNVPSLVSTGAISGTTGTFSSTVSGVAGTFSGAVSGTTGTFSSTLTGATLGTNAVVQMNSSGTLTFRPNTGSATAQMTYTTAGLLTTGGGIVATGSVTGTSFIGSAADLTNIGTPIAAQSVGGVGTYAFCRASGAVAAGGTIAGSSLTYTGASGDTNGGNPSGTWRAMGAAEVGSNGSLSTLFLRIS